MQPHIFNDSTIYLGAKPSEPITEIRTINSTEVTADLRGVPKVATELDLDDKVLRQKNREDGIAEYIDGQNKALGKIYVTPRGPYSVLKQVEVEFDMYRKTILQRFKSKRGNLSEWYVIEGHTPLQPEEDCAFCDQVDDLLFAKDCWLDRCSHGHGTEMEDGTVITYLFKGDSYKVTYKELMKGELPHESLQCKRR